MKCFNAPLQPEELLGVKKVVQDKMPNVRSLATAFCYVNPHRAGTTQGWPAQCKACGTHRRTQGSLQHAAVDSRRIM